MRKLWLIIKREYITRVRKRSFIISTLLAPLGIVLLILTMFLFDSIGEKTSDKEITNFLVNDQAQLLTKQYQLNNTENLYFQPYSQLLDTGLSVSVIHIPANFDIHKPNKAKIKIKANEQLPANTVKQIKNQLTEIIKKKQLIALNIQPQTIENINQTSLDFNFEITEKTSDKDKSKAIASGIGLAIGWIMYMTIFIYGALIMRGVMEEKQSKIIEVLMVSVKPFYIMTGKIIGISLVAITQFLAWGILSGTAIFILSFIMAGTMPAPNLDTYPTTVNPEMLITPETVDGYIQAFLNLPFSLIIPGVLFFFIFGYLIYGAMFACVGAISGDDGESYGYTMPISMPIFLSLVAMFSVIQNPNSGLAIFMSMFPLTSPIVMSARLAFNPPIWQVLLSMIIMLLGFFGTAFVASKIYRIGILITGKKITVKQIIKWVITPS